MKNQSVRVILGYAPQETERQEVREAFFTELDVEIANCVMANEMPIVLGDMNAKITPSFNNEIQEISQIIIIGIKKEHLSYRLLLLLIGYFKLFTLSLRLFTSVSMRNRARLSSLSFVNVLCSSTFGLVILNGPAYSIFIFRWR